MQPTIPVLGGLEGLLDNVIVGELVLPDGQVDSDDILPHNPASANVQMADLRVAHETIGETNGERGGFEFSETGRARG